MNIQPETNEFSQKMDNLNCDSSILYNLDIDNALDNIKKRKFYTQEEAKDIAEKWGKKPLIKNLSV
ncbi:hypothetical protein [Flavobacterium ajazii]|uniref:hypothetical protein n=1 Tax=Flavobacterium ajazii TaxID=2692318 RepID=UPI0013D11C22|nr:hypothetical protein [Flavobacterium ajazii]